MNLSISYLRYLLLWRSQQGQLKYFPWIVTIYLYYIIFNHFIYQILNPYYLFYLLCYHRKSFAQVCVHHIIPQSYHGLTEAIHTQVPSNYSITFQQWIITYPIYVTMRALSCRCPQIAVVFHHLVINFLSAYLFTKLWNKTINLTFFSIFQP